VSKLDFKGLISESYLCIDCGFNTAPGNLDRAESERYAEAQLAAGIKEWGTPVYWSAQQETYIVHNHVWKKAGMEPYGGCLCIACLEKRIGRRLIPDDFPKHPFNEMVGTARLLERRGHFLNVIGDFPAELLSA
jgi:hypothetical protein